MLECEYLVIGGGETGILVARELARYGKKTILVEENQLGGTFVHTHDVPKNALMAESIAWSECLQLVGTKGKEYQQLLGKRLKISSKITDVTTKNEKHFFSSIQSISGITYIQGKVEITSKTLVEINSQTERHLVHFSHCVICVGKDQLVKPDINGIEAISFWYQDTIFNLPEIPQKLGIIGITPHTLEVAHIFSNLGVNVEMYNHTANESLQQTLDSSAINYTFKKLLQKNVSILPKVFIDSVKMGKNDQVNLVDTSKELHSVSHVYIPLKREFADDLLPGLKTAGIEYTKKGIQTDDCGQTKVGSFSALGQCNLRTNSGSKYAIIHRFLEKHLQKTDFTLPGKMGLSLLNSGSSSITTPVTCVQSSQPVCTIGITETEAIGQYGPIAKTRLYYNQAEDSFVKITFKKSTGDILGISLGGQYCTKLQTLCVFAMENALGARNLVNFLKTYVGLQ